MPKVKYVQLEPAAYPTDTDWLMMSAEERGIYHSLNIYLYCNDGKLKNNKENLSNLCNVSQTAFEYFLKKYIHKFKVKNGVITHKRVTRQLIKARKQLKQKSLAGKASANARSTGVQTTVGTAVELSETKRNESKRREGKGIISNSKERSYTSSNSLRFISELEKIIRPGNQSDRTAFRNLCKWLAEKIHVKQFEDDIYIKVLDYASEAKNGRKPVAVFFATLKREIGYKAVG